MKIILPLLFVLLTTMVASAQTDLFFSEYVEGSGNNKALEIYNPTNQTIDLSNYYVLRYSNGASTYAEGGITHLTGTIASFKTFVLVNGQTAATSTSSSPACSLLLQGMANQLDGAYPAPTYMNGNDAMALIKTPGGVAPAADMSNVTSVDLIGQVGLGAAITAETGWSNVKDTTISYTVGGVAVTGKVVNYIVQKYATNGSSTGPYWMAWTANHSLIRKPSIITGVKNNPVPFVVIKEWDTIPAVVDSLGHLVYEDIWTNLGKHKCDAASAGVDETPSGASINIYPNPIVDHFTVSSSISIKEIEIFSVIGQSVYKQIAKKGQQQIEVGPLELEKGMYLVKVISSNKVSSVKKILVK